MALVMVTELGLTLMVHAGVGLPEAERRWSCRTSANLQPSAPAVTPPNQDQRGGFELNSSISRAFWWSDGCKGLRTAVSSRMLTPGHWRVTTSKVRGN